MSIVLDLDFLASETLDVRVTASGAANGTRVNSAGVIVAATAPRYDYDPVTRAPKGLLIEEARTQLLTYPADFSNAVWTKGATTQTPAAAASPFGLATATKIVENSSNANHYVAHAAATVSNGATVCCWALLKAGERTHVALIEANGNKGKFFNLGAGTVGGNLIAAPLNAGILDYGNGWYLCWIVTAAPATSVNLEIYLSTDGSTYSYLGNGASGIYVAHTQLEVGAFPTSTIQGTSAAVTRSADVPTITGANFSSWFNAAAGTLIAEFDILDYVPGAGRAGGIFGMGTSAPRVFIATAPGIGRPLEAQNYDGTTARAARPANFNDIAINTPHRVALAYDTTTSQLALNGVAGTANTTIAVDLSTIARAVIGNQPDTNVYLNGHMRRVKFDNTKRSTADLVALTSAISGSAAITEGGDTLAGAGQVKIKGAAAITEDADTVSSGGEVGIAPIVPDSRRIIL